MILVQRKVHQVFAPQIEAYHRDELMVVVAVIVVVHDVVEELDQWPMGMMTTTVVVGILVVAELERHQFYRCFRIYHLVHHCVTD